MMFFDRSFAFFRFTDSELLQSQRDADLMAEEVRREFVHCWRGYKKVAWGQDEVAPVSGGGRNWAFIGITILDSVDTVWLMDLKKEFQEAMDFVRKLNFQAMAPHYVSVFETVIRGLGGLLSAYSLSGEKVFLEKAEELGTRLMRAFSTPNGLPRPSVDLQSGASKFHTWSPHNNIAEIGTLQVGYWILFCMYFSTQFGFSSRSSGNMGTRIVVAMCC